MEKRELIAKGYRTPKNDTYKIYIPVISRWLIPFDEAVVMMTDDGFKIRESTLLDNKCYKLTKNITDFSLKIKSKHTDLTGDFEMEVIGDWIYFIKDI